MADALNVFVIAGEASGDRLGADLLSGLRQNNSCLTAQGVGGPLMAAQGVHSLFPISDLSVMGLVEVLPRIPTLLRRIKQTIQAIIENKPDVLVTIDSPDFCLRVIAKVKEKLPALKVVHYVAPSVWAWRPERAEKMAKHVDHVLALLPFEPPYMERAGMSCDFVGHPVTQEPDPDEASIVSFCNKYKININSPAKTITLLPGSRNGEIRRMAPVFSHVVRNLSNVKQDLRLILPVAHGVEKQVHRMIENWPIQPILLSSKHTVAVDLEIEKRIAYRLSDCALATSGTVALELAAADCPMVVAYKSNWATTRMVKRMAQIDSANLVNIVTDTRTVPEFLFENCTPSSVSDVVVQMVSDEDFANEQKAALSRTMMLLGKDDPRMRGAAARSVLEFLGKT